MARFLAEIQGQRGEASRLGSVSSGIRAHVRGWDIGVAVYGETVDGQDFFEVYATGGSNNRSERRMIGTVKLDADSRPVLVIPTVGIRFEDPTRDEALQLRATDDPEYNEAERQELERQ